MGRNWYRNCSVLRTDSVLSFSFDCTASVLSYVRKVYSRYPLGILILAFPISRCLHEIFGFSFQGLSPLSGQVRLLFTRAKGAHAACAPIKNRSTYYSGYVCIFKPTPAGYTPCPGLPHLCLHPART